MNILDDKQVTDLQTAVDWSRRALEQFRKNRRKFVRQYTGYWYSERGADKPVPVNLMEMAVQIFLRQLAANAPQVLVTTKWRHLQPSAAKLTQAGDALIREINFEQSLRSWVLDALFGFGIMKTGVAHGGRAEILGFLHDIYQPYADVVSLDDWVHDMGAKRWDQLTFMGDRIRLPYEAAMDSGLYDRAVIERAGTTDLSLYDEFGVEKTEAISRGSYNWRQEYKRHLDLEEIWLPQDNLLVTFPAATGAEARGWTKPARIVEWSGPEEGPYTRLCFADVPDQIMPLAPAMVMMDLHQLMNVIWRKLGRQAERQKTVGFVRAGGRKDGETIINANDGEAVSVEDPGSFREFRTGGIDQQNFGFAMSVKQLFSYLNGNLDALGGLGPQADTLGQEQIISSSVSKRIREMQERTASATKQVMRHLLWYLWNDPVREVPIRLKVPGVQGLAVHTTWGPLDREGDFLQYNFDITPYSMQDRTPAQRLQTIMQLLNQYFMPLAGPMQQQGIGIDFEALTRRIASYAGMDELEEFITFTGAFPDQPPAPMGRQPANRPPHTTRTYERISRQAPSPDAQNQQLIQGMMAGGAGRQPTPVAAAG